MTNRAAADRYARVLLEVAVKEADPEAVERELAGFVELLSSNAAAERALTNPAVPVTRKRAAVAELMTHAAASPVTVKLLVLLASRDRLVLLPDLLAAYRRRLLEHLKVVHAEVTTAVPLTDDRRRAFEARLADATGRRVTIETRVDPALIGGAVTQIGSLVFDGSVRMQLQRLREKLTETI